MIGNPVEKFQSLYCQIRKFQRFESLVSALGSMLRFGRC